MSQHDCSGPCLKEVRNKTIHSSSALKPVVNLSSFGGLKSKTRDLEVSCSSCPCIPSDIASVKPSALYSTSLFRAFVRTSVGEQSNTGSGLGLAIIKGIVSVSGGRLVRMAEHYVFDIFQFSFIRGSNLNVTKGQPSGSS